MSDTLMISVSGMRGIVGKDLTPELVARHAAALGAWVRASGGTHVVLGRDARTAGAMFARAATAGFSRSASTSSTSAWCRRRRCRWRSSITAPAPG